jgi:hypothetical protein
MLYVLGFKGIAVVAGDVFFVDPNPAPGQDGAESGVRVELRTLERMPLRSSIYSAQPIGIEAPLARIDLFESFPDGRGRADRVHFHPKFDGWDPGRRQFDAALSADPIGWLGKQLQDVSAVLTPPGLEDAQSLAEHADEIVEAVERLWTTVRSGVLDPPGDWPASPSFRHGWL